MNEKWETTIDYSLCKKLSISIIDYCIIDIIRQLSSIKGKDAPKINQSKIAKVLGVSRQTICNKMAVLQKRKILIAKGSDLRNLEYGVAKSITPAPKVVVRKVRKKVVKKAPGENGLFQGFMGDYFEFFEKRNDVKPKITGADGKALKEIIKHLTYLTRDKFKDVEDKEINNMARQGWQLMLDNWNALEPFLQKQTKLIQINSNFNNIVENIRNGKKKPTNNEKQSGISNLKQSIYRRNFGDAPGSN